MQDYRHIVISIVCNENKLWYVIILFEGYV